MKKRLEVQVNDFQYKWLTDEAKRLNKQDSERLVVSKRELMDRVLNAAIAGKAYKGAK